MRKGKMWNEEEIQEMVRLFQIGKSLNEVADTLSRSENAVTAKFVKEGLHKLYPNVDCYPKIHIAPEDTPSLKWRQHPKYKKYYFSEAGDVWSAIYGRKLTPFKLAIDKEGKKGLWIRIEGRTLKLSRLVAETWLGLENDQVVAHKNRNKCDNDIFNLLVLSKKECGQITGHLSNAKPVGRYLNGKCVEVYKSSRSAAKALGVSYQTILDYANQKVSKPKYEIRFIYKENRRDVE